MKKTFLSLSVAALTGGFAAGAFAGVLPGTQPNADVDSLSQVTTTELRFAADGRGHILLVPYYSAQNGNTTVINIINTDTLHGKAVKVRFRGAQNSDDVFDFQLYLSPGDVWTGQVQKGSNNGAMLVTPDNSCTIPATVSGQSFIAARLPGQNIEGTLEGYVEIFNMADILPQGNTAEATEAAAATPTTTIYPKVKHKADGTVECGLEAVNGGRLLLDITSELDARAQGFNTPTGGLMGSWTILNVPEAAAWGGNASVIAATNATGVIGRGNFVWFPQTADTAAVSNLTADPLLLKGLINAAYYDLPDLSTPYVTAVAPGAAELQASLLAKSIAVTSVSNEFITDPAFGGMTDWVFSMPTRRYALAVDYAATGNAKLVFNRGVYNTTVSAAVADHDNAQAATITNWALANGAYFSAATGASLPQTVDAGPYTSAGGGVNVRLDGNTACIGLGGSAVSFFDRSERTAQAGAVISPGTPVSAELCGETNVVAFNALSGTSVLGAKIARSDISTNSFISGWASINTAFRAAGLPVLGQSFVKATNGNVGIGAAANYGANWDHRFTR